jgi:AraC-like DNA-binding protein
MDHIYKFDTVNEYNALNDHETFHPLVNVIDFSNAKPRSWNNQKNVKINYGLYCIFLKDVKCGDLKYGCNYYDYEKGTLVFVAPGQVVEFETNGELYQPKGYALVFHPDLIHGTSLAKQINEYSFFGYQNHEALHLSEKEKEIVLDCLCKIEYEIKHTVDKHSKKLIVSNIELFLNYCTRFYDRQFITRDNVNKGILEKFEAVLSNYYKSDTALQAGLPSVAYCASALHLSPNYFGDLIKKETGKSALEYIQNKIIERAKSKILEEGKSINEVAYELGFKYPQHFTRLFRQKVGVSPTEFRSLN